MNERPVVKTLIHVEALPDYRLKLRYDDGFEGVVDLSRHVGKGVFSGWNDPEVFQKVRIGDFGEPVWDGGIDLCPDALYLEASGGTVEQMFPGWKPEGAHA